MREVTLRNTDVLRKGGFRIIFFPDKSVNTKMFTVIVTGAKKKIHYLGIQSTCSINEGESTHTLKQVVFFFSQHIR